MPTRRLSAWTGASLAQAGTRSYIAHAKEGGEIMRAEIEAIVEEIKQSVGLLRRHL
jgi:hypothetical protein